MFLTSMKSSLVIIKPSLSPSPRYNTTISPELGCFPDTPSSFVHHGIFCPSANSCPSEGQTGLLGAYVVCSHNEAFWRIIKSSIMIFNDLLFILCVCGGDVHMSAAAQRPEAPNRLELESQRVVSCLLWTWGLSLAPPGERTLSSTEAQTGAAAA